MARTHYINPLQCSSQADQPLVSSSAVRAAAPYLSSADTVVQHSRSSDASFSDAVGLMLSHAHGPNLLTDAHSGLPCPEAWCEQPLTEPAPAAYQVCCVACLASLLLTLLTIAWPQPTVYAEGCEVSSLLSITGMAEFECCSFEELRLAYLQRWADCQYRDGSGAAPLHAAAARLHAATDRWAAVRAAAAAAAKPDGYTLETSFTSAQPMHGWTLRHAIRELWQNFRDGVSAGFGAGPLVPSFSSGRAVLAELLHEACREDDGETGGFDFSGDGSVASNDALLGRVSLSCGGVGVGSIDASAPDTLIFRQRFAALQPTHLLLASSKGSSSAGAHGEGFKVAINFLLRHGFSVTYAMDGQRWSFVHRSLHSPDILTMVVEMRRTRVASTDLVIEICGPEAASLFRIDQDWELLNAALAATSFTSDAIMWAVPPSAPPNLRTPGEVVSVNSSFRGRVYCRNLFVAVDYGLSFLGLAVNLDFKLQRDRHELPRDLPKFVGRALKALAVLHGHAAPPMGALCEHVLAAFRGVPELHEYAPRLRELLRAHVAWREGCKLDEVVFLHGDDRNGALSGLGLVQISHAGELADRCTEDIALERISRLVAWEPELGGREAVRLGWLAALTGAVSGFWEDGFKLQLCAKVQTPGVEGGTCVPFLRIKLASAQGHCYISSQHIDDPAGWRIAAQLLSAELSPLLPSRDDGAAMASALAGQSRARLRGVARRSLACGSQPATDDATTPMSSSRCLKTRTCLESTQSHDAAAAADEHVPACSGAARGFPRVPPPDVDFVEPLLRAPASR